jgi:hypothetical protein
MILLSGIGSTIPYALRAIPSWHGFAFRSSPDQRHGVAKNVTDCKSVPAGNQQSSITSTLIASAAKQSSRVVHPTGGLLRRCAPRNDGGFYRVPLWGKKKPRIKSRA